jgi:hypothetical protein
MAGLVSAPPVLALAGSASEPDFYAIGAQAVPGGSSFAANVSVRQARAGTVTARASTVQRSKGEQILQVVQGIQGIGNNGLAVAAGPKHVMEVGSQVARAYTKNTGQQVTSKTINQFFGVGVSTATISQPTVVYDPIGKRWIAVAITDRTGDIGLVLRVSKTSTPVPFGNSKWFKSVRFADTSTTVPDLNPDVIESKPAIGVSSDKIAITTVADDPSDVTVMNRLFFFPKAPLYNNSATPGVWTADVNGTYDGQTPAVNASKQPNIFIAIPDTSDVTLTTYTGAAKSNPPVFSKNVVYPTGDLLPPPIVDQGSGDDLDLGPLAFFSAAWRGNKLWAAATVNCGGDACVRVFEIGTSSGVTLNADEKLSAAGKDWFSPAVAIDGGGYVHLAATDVGSAVGPSQAVFARTGTNKWTAPRFIRKGNKVVGSGGTTDWWKSNSAALDPTSPWDVWVAGASGDTGVPVTNLTTRVARVSLAKNVATLRASASSVRRGGKVTFTVKLTRPGSKDVVRGLPIALQRKPANGGKWATVKSGKTAANGTARWTLKIKRAALYRTFGAAVKQSGGQGRVFDSCVSKSRRISLR